LKYAIISDIHGNIDALLAVLHDAKSCNVDKYIFVGDYCSCFPYPNDVVETICQIPDAVVVSGNEEEYLLEYAKQDQSTWIDGQFQAHYWLYKNLSDTNHKYLSKLPKIISFNDGDKEITVTHKSSDLYGDIEYKEFSSNAVAKKYENGFSARAQILHDIQEYMHSNEEYTAAVQSLADGIYIFGHMHIQWHSRYINKIFINPGSCGLPLDGECGAPYTLLEISKNSILIDERRVPYDLNKLKHELKSSDLYKSAPVWIEIVLEQIEAKFERALTFLQFVKSHANNTNDNIRPFSVKTWSEAFTLWTADKLRGNA